MVFLLVATVHRIGSDGRVVDIAADDVHIGIVLQGIHESVVEVVVSAPTGSRGVIVDIGRRRHHDILAARHRLRNQLVTHEIRTSSSVVCSLSAVRSYGIVGNIHRDGVVGGNNGAAEMVGGSL